MDLRGKKVTVVGLGRSGIAACNLLIEKEARVSVTECLDNQKIRENVLNLDKENIVEIETGRHTESLIEGRDLVVTSPGVSVGALPLAWAKKEGIPVISEIELAFRFCPAPIIAITGTNGKTTVTTVVGEIFKAAGRECLVCGNIGNPFSAEVHRLTQNHVVILEVSSFQLETIEKFRAKVAVVLNLTADHLDRHADFNEYLAAKCRIFENQTEEDWVVLSQEDDKRFKFAEKSKGKLLYYSDISRYSDPRVRNFNSNYLAALTISSIFDITEIKAIDTCANFRGLEHRLEEVAFVEGITFINDSKATNVDSTLWALDVLRKPIVLIAGGRDKGSDFASVKDKIKDKVKSMVLLGEAKEKMQEAFSGLILTKSVHTLSQAVDTAFTLAHPGDCVLLSPMCASFDMFENYVERGRAFKQAVYSLAQISRSKV